MGQHICSLSLLSKTPEGCSTLAMEVLLFCIVPRKRLYYHFQCFPRWVFGFWAEWKVYGLLRRWCDGWKVHELTSISSKRGYQTWPGHAGAITNDVARSLIFFTTWRSSTIGAWMNDVQLCHSNVSATASTAIAPRSGYLDIYRGSWWFSRDANKSTCGV